MAWLDRGADGSGAAGAGAETPSAVDGWRTAAGDTPIPDCAGPPGCWAGDSPGVHGPRLPEVTHLPQQLRPAEPHLVSIEVERIPVPAPLPLASNLRRAVRGGEAGPSFRVARELAEAVLVAARRALAAGARVGTRVFRVVAIHRALEGRGGRIPVAHSLPRCGHPDLRHLREDASLGHSGVREQSLGGIGADLLERFRQVHLEGIVRGNPHELIGAVGRVPVPGQENHRSDAPLRHSRRLREYLDTHRPLGVRLPAIRERRTCRRQEETEPPGLPRRRAPREEEPQVVACPAARHLQIRRDTEFLRLLYRVKCRSPRVRECVGVTCTSVEVEAAPDGRAVRRQGVAADARTHLHGVMGAVSTLEVDAHRGGARPCNVRPQEVLERVHFLRGEESRAGLAVGRREGERVVAREEVLGQQADLRSHFVRGDSMAIERGVLEDGLTIDRVLLVRR